MKDSYRVTFFNQITRSSSRVSFVDDLRKDFLKGQYEMHRRRIREQHHKNAQNTGYRSYLLSSLVRLGIFSPKERMAIQFFSDKKVFPDSISK